MMYVYVYKFESMFAALRKQWNPAMNSTTFMFGGSIIMDWPGGPGPNDVPVEEVYLPGRKVTILCTAKRTSNFPDLALERKIET